MKLIWPLLAAGLLLCPAGARAQGYSGVMAPQDGYHAPPPAAHSGGGASQGGDFGSPYSGTGASDTTGYANMMNDNNGAATQDYTQPDTAMPDDDAPQHARTSAFVESFAPKAKDDDDRGGVSIYDQVQDNSGSATDRRRRAIIRKVDAEQRKAREQMKRAMADHDREVQAYIKKTVRDSMPKKDGDDGTDDEQPDEGQADDSSSPDAVKE